ncbi:type III-A CRISPR-associated RAMP protein Csm5 [Streptococcus fryi]
MSTRRFDFRLLTLAPVHIGNGKTYTNKEYILENQRLYFPDMAKLYAHLITINRHEAFERFLLRDGEGKRLIDFLNDQKISTRDFGGYSLDTSLLVYENHRKKRFDNRKSKEFNGVNQFVRDPFDKVYIPGSSLKGAIRTILMNTRWKQDNFKLQRGNKVVENRTVIPWGAKKDKPFDDLFHHIHVSDSLPLEIDCLMVAQKWDYSSRKVIPESLPVYREAIKPMTHLRFTITTTSDEAAELIEHLQTYASEFYSLYRDFFLRDLKDKYKQDNVQYPIYIGAGSGVWTKTVMKQAEREVLKRHQKLKTKMVGKGVFKLTKSKQQSLKTTKGMRNLIRNEDSFYEMGKCCFIIKEM